MKVTMKGISLKTVKEDDEYVDKYIVNFQVLVDTFEESVETAKVVEKKLQHTLDGQTFLTGKKR